ncbi:MAG: hypothetical protein ACRD12_01095, partial [Acidimicrobiales bacterium]
ARQLGASRVLRSLGAPDSFLGDMSSTPRLAMTSNDATRAPENPCYPRICRRYSLAFRRDGHARCHAPSECQRERSRRVSALRRLMSARTERDPEPAAAAYPGDTFGPQDPTDSARRVLEGLVDNRRRAYLVYSSHPAWQLYDQVGRLIRLAEGRISATTVRDAQDLARIQGLLYRAGKHTGLQSVAADEFRPGYWDADLVLLGANVPTSSATRC